jgi:hypothetical protein
MKYNTNTPVKEYVRWIANTVMLSRDKFPYYWDLRDYFQRVIFYYEV